MLRFQRFRTAAMTIAGIELSGRTQKGHFNFGGLRIKDKSASAIWKAVLTR
jgi:hypothetical protein